MTLTPMVARSAAEKAAMLQEIKAATEFVDDYVTRHGHPFPASMAMFMPDDEVPGTGGDNANPTL